jgi:hypothetical protein
LGLIRLLLETELDRHSNTVIKIIIISPPQTIAGHAFILFYILSYLSLNLLLIKLKPDHKNKKPRHIAENPWN